MSWKVKVTIGKVSVEMEIPLSERNTISLDNDETTGKSLAILEQLTDKVLKTSLEFEERKSKPEELNGIQELNS